MKNKILSISIIIASLLFCSCQGVKKGIKKEDRVDVQKAFDAVYDAVQEAKTVSKIENKLKLEGIELSFATGTTKEGAVEASLFVVSGKYTRTKSKSNKAVFSFGPPEDKKAFTEKSREDLLKEINGDFKVYLLDVMKTAEKLKDKPAFELNGLEIEVEFTVKNAGEGGVKLELTPFELSGAVSIEKEVTHTITIKFAKNK